MKIIKVTPRGYCKGVVRAINIAKETVQKYPQQPIYILGMLVHNEYVKKALEMYGIQTLDDKNKIKEELLKSIEHGVVIFTAHGIAPTLKQQAINQGLVVVDASCPDVLTTQQLVSEYLDKQYDIIYIGKKGHPEASAICSLSNHVYLVESEDDICSLSLTKPIFVTNQTTMSIYDVDNLFQSIKKKYPKAIISEEICNATRTRQEAVTQLDKNIDVLIVVGDKASNNSKKLVQIGKEHGIPLCILVDDVNDLNIAQLQKYQTIAISSGASTPTYLTNQVIQCLEQNIQEKQIIHIEKIL